MEPLKIFYVTENWLPSVGGLESSTRYLLSVMVCKLNIELLTFGEPHTVSENECNVRYFSESDGRTFYKPAFEYIAAHGGPAVIHIFGFSEFRTHDQAQFIHNLRRRTQYPVVLKVPTSGHSKLYLNHSDFSAVSDVNIFVALTDDISNELIENGVEPSRIFRVSNGAPVDRFYPRKEGVSPCIDRFMNERRPVLLFAGRFTEQKRLDLLIKALNSIPLNQRPIVLLVGYVDHTYNDGFDIEKYTSDILVHIPTVKQMETVYPFVDGYVSPSGAEGMSNSVLEAMASGLPIIASDIPGHRELVVHNVNGWLFPLSDWRALAFLLEDAARLKDAGALVEMGKHSRQLVIDKFSMLRIREEYLQLYASLSRNQAHKRRQIG